MSPINYQLKLPTQWSIHDIFHIDLLTPYQETLTHGVNYSRPPPDLINDQEEYEVKKILDSWHFGRRCKLQYLVKWKGYPDSDNEWVDKGGVHTDQAIREFKSCNSTPKAHISTGIIGKSLTPLIPTSTTTKPLSPMSHVYYTQSPGQVYA